MALDVYSRLAEWEAMDYMKIKKALLERLDFIRDVVRHKFLVVKPQRDNMALSCYQIRLLNRRLDKTFNL